MKYYEEMLSKKCFALNDVVSMVGGNMNTAKSLLNDYAKKGYVKSVKRNLYVAISMETNSPIATPYHIASNITGSSYVSNHAAFAYYGYTNQVFYDVSVSSKTEFKSFEFDMMTYSYVSSKSDAGIITEQGIRVTDRERTLIDNISDFDKIGGLEELLRSLEMITFLSEDKLAQYLSIYNRPVLYQKAGYILEHFMDTMKISPGFINLCHQNKGSSIRYLTKTIPRRQLGFNSKWGLMVPDDLLYALS
jgi:predicted transcriptional regulator of viral defense system